MVASRPEPLSSAPIAIVPAPGGTASAADATNSDSSVLAALLQFEGEVRRQQSITELQFHTANEARRIVDYEQMFVLRRARLGDGYHVVCVSSLATVDRNAPLIQAIEAAMSKLEADHSLLKAQAFGADAFSKDVALDEYPFGAWHWQPLIGSDDKDFAGLLLARAEPLREGEVFRLARVAETVGHAWRALTNDQPVRRIAKIGPKEKRGLIAVAVFGFLYPVQMTALAPVEVVPERPFFIAAPFSGVISRIHVAPNAAVKRGQTLISFDDVKLSNELKLAEERLAVAKARSDRATSAAFGAGDETREISTMQAEYELAAAEYKFAKDVMEKSQIKAPRSGMAIYSDRRDWEGRAINVGDPIMQVADSANVVLRIDLPAAEQMALPKGAPVKAWLDAQPLWAIDGRVENASYQARPTAQDILAFSVTANVIAGRPRIGSRGTAKLYGKWVPLGYSVLKRPIASLRQFVGI